jgi:hypothetical protein
MYKLTREDREHELDTCFQQKFAMGSNGVGIGCTCCLYRACGLGSSLVHKKKLEKMYFSSQGLIS